MEKLSTKLTEIPKKIQNSKPNINPSGKSWISSKKSSKIPIIFLKSKQIIITAMFRSMFQNVKHQI
jgi:hypothetical protein